MEGIFLLYDFAGTQIDISPRTVALFRCKMAFFEMDVEADPVGVQRHTVPHFNGLN